MTSPETQPTPATDPDSDPQDSYEVLVIGAGQAGLTLGYYLRQAGVRFLIVDAADQVGSAWAQRWDSLVLFTPRRYNAMPGLSFNGDLDQEPTRDEVIAYLHRYATEFDLPIHVNSAVTALHHADGRYVAELPTGTIHADHVVVATGPFQLPRIPDFASSVASDVYQTHSSGYRRPIDLPPGRVVVVGGGNTGYQIAEELAADHPVVLAVGSRQPPLPRRLLGQQIFWWLTTLRMQRITIDSRLGRRLRDRETLIGSSPAKAKRRGITLKPRALDASGRAVRFADGTSVEADAIIWATGFESDYSWIQLPIADQQGLPRHRRGVTDQPGLYFLGLQWQHTRGSALLGLGSDDARYIVQHIIATSKASQTSQASR
jgi:putative flavoprotein involved in K+ transport